MDAVIKSAEGDAGFVQALEAALLRDLRQSAEQAVNGPITLSVTDPGAGLVAGLHAATSYGWLRVNMLWVAEGKRRSGLGRALLQEAQSRATARGCHACWLETSNPAAKQFYERCGYAVFATLTNDPHHHPAGHSRWFLKRGLLR